MGGACSAHGREMQKVFSLGKLKERDALEDPGLDGGKMLKLILK
jgi:hypothetical protein